IVFTVRSAFPATSEFGTPTPNVFSILTTSSNASMESRPSPSGPKSGSSSPICSGVTCSIRFLTSISLIWARKFGSDINERGFCRKLRVRSNVQNVRTVSLRPKRCEDASQSKGLRAKSARNAAFVSRKLFGVRTRPRVAFEKLDLIGFIAGSHCDTRLRRGDARNPLVVSSRDGRFSRFHVRLGNLRIRLPSLVQFVVELVFCLLKLLDRLTHSAGKFGQFLCSKQNKDDQQDDD